MANITMSMEDYLEAISHASAEHGIARVRDIKAIMGVKTPSVTGAVRLLAKNGFLTHEKYGYIELTPKGKKAADEIKKRHALLKSFLRDILKADATTAEADACKMEHALSEKTFTLLSKFVEKHTKTKKAK